MKIYLIILTVFGWFALLTQFCIIIHSGIAAPGELVIRFFSYFTILTNLMLAVCTAILIFKPQSRTGTFFSKETTLTALTVYIIVVGLIYNLVLRFLWHPEGLQRIADELLHTIIPLSFLGYWFLFVSKVKLHWGGFLPWLIYPLIYVVYTFVRGHFSHFYPYPFLDVAKIGLAKALINSVIVSSIFVLISFLLIAIGKFQERQRSGN